MRWVILALSILTGCASSPEIRNNRISRQELAGISGLSSYTNANLDRLVRQEGARRVDDADSARSPHLTIRELVLKSKQSELQMDDSFAKVHFAVKGREVADQEQFAEIVSDALLQKNFACEQPVYADYLQARYGGSRPERSCHNRLPFATLSQKDGYRINWLDIDRVSEIHLVFTGASENIASRFGHVSLRLVVCPQGVNAKEACDRNLSEHYSLGFLAQVDELSLSTIKALTGSYRAYLYARPFIDAYEEYAIHEFRDVYSLPLKLDASQRERLLRGLAEIHWQYEGEYRFFGNNCSSILQRALRLLLPEYAASSALKEDFMRPDHFFEAVRGEQWADDSKLRDLKQAVHDGYFFSNTRPYYEKALLTLKSAGSAEDIDQLEEYRLIPPSVRGSRHSTDVRYIERLKSDRTLREAEIMLEQYAMFYSERMLVVAGGRLLEDEGTLDINTLGKHLDTESKQYVDECFLSPIRMQFKPFQRYPGIPEKPAFSDIINAPTRCKSPEGLKILSAAFSVLEKENAEGWQRMRVISQYWAETVRNINELEKL